jgi:eukaryotic-like serine/threonine-protein kinase
MEDLSQQRPTEPAATLADESGPSEEPGTQIGRYKLLENIGEGGFGSVWAAEQKEPVKRRVALKIIKLGMDTRQVVARFEAERQALALMDHPNIAKVFDAGATDSGRPFFVMELVKGIPITKYCEREKLPTRERLDLFIKVCQAIQHAHQKGIIHRDIKPSNILVTLSDGVPVPKVIDFGIAKATQQELTEKTVYTQHTQFIGTPAYMSPEQAELSGLDIDTRSDIYGLGVLLYELLTGTTPFDTKKLLESGLDEMRRIIREQEPERPSTRLSQTQARSADGRTPSPSAVRNWRASIASDLDWIVMKCLEKDRTRRYETANGLGMDLRRYLNHEPVVARPPSRGYQFRKFVRRNKLAFAASGAVGAALVLGVIVSTVLAVRATRAEREQGRLRRQAELNRQRSETEAAKATAISDLLQQMLRSANPDALKGSEYTVRQLLDEFSAGLANQLKDQPEVEAAVRATIGRTYYRLGFADKAQAHHERALALRRRVFGDQSEPVAESLVDYAWSCFEQEQFARGEPYVREALEIYRKRGATGQPVISALWVLQKLVSAQGQEKEVNAVTAQALAIADQSPGVGFSELASMIHGLAELKNGQSRFAEAETLAQRAVEMHRRLRSADHPETAWALVSLGTALRGQQKLTEAEAALREALRIFRKYYTFGHKSVDAAMGELRLTLEAKRDAPALEALYREMLAAQRATLGSDHPAVAETLGTLAANLYAQGKQAEAEKAFCESMQLMLKMHDQDLIRLPPVVRQLADVQRLQGKVQDSEKLYEQAIQAARRSLGDSHPVLGELLHDYAEYLGRESKHELAAEYRLKSLPIRRARPDDNLAWTLRNLGGDLVLIGRAKEAEAYLREALALHRSLHDREDINGTAWATERLGYALYLQERLPQAEQAYRDALQACAKCQAVGGEHYTAAVRGLLTVLQVQHKPQAIEALLRDVLAQERKALGANHITVVATLLDLGEFLESQRRPAEAAKCRDEAEGIISALSSDDLSTLPATAVAALICLGQQEQTRRVGDKVLAMPAAPPVWLNDVAWTLALAPKPPAWGPGIAIELAQKAVVATSRTNDNILDTLAAAYAAARQFTNAIAVQQEALALLQNEELRQDYALRLKLYEANVPYREDGPLAESVKALLEQGKYAEAEPLARECLAIREQQFSDDWRTFNSRSLLGESLLGQGKYTEAEPLLLAGCEGLRQCADKMPAGATPRLGDALRRLVRLYEATPRPDLAAQWKQRLEEFDQATLGAKPVTNRFYRAVTP